MITFDPGDFPEWRGRTDRQVGRALWRLLKRKNLAEGLRRREGKLEPTSTPWHQVLFGPRGFAWTEPRRSSYASFASALELAAKGSFVAAGAVYVLLMQRIVEASHIAAQDRLVRRRKSRGAAKARAIRQEKAAARRVKIATLTGSSGQVARRIKVSPSTVRRYRKYRKT
jgi:hypothetical protein